MNEMARIPSTRNLAPASLTRTRLFARPGQTHVVVLNEQKGFLMLRAGVRAVWSHFDDLDAMARSFHPDVARTVDSYADEQQAKAETRRFITLDDALGLHFLRVQADCAEGSDNAFTGPVERVSVIAACNALGAVARKVGLPTFEPLACHAFDRHMRGLRSV
jgi:hypothetical protein